ncbi:hypothetical protein ACLOJK_039378 [Asimina triloba]
MADVVQYRLERMLDELDDLERRGLFTRREIAEIVKKRRGFEYKLKRPSPLKQDYIAYIEYETQMDSLRRLRKKSIIRELKKKQAAEDDEGGGRKKRNVWKRSASDNAGVLRILEIYRLAVSRYKGDINLWFRYLEFCRERGHGRMMQLPFPRKRKVLAQVIRFHPKVPGLWIYAAAWEFDHNLNVAAARALMQSGLRACPDSEDLWVEYLRMELTYLNKLRARKVALGEEVRTQAHTSDDSNNQQWKEENKDLFMPLIEGGDVANEASVSEEDKDTKVDTFREQGSVVLRAIYSGAVEALPTSMSLRKRFLEILDGTDLAYSDELKKDIMDDIKKDFSGEEDYWDWLARLQISDFEKGKEMGKETLVCQLNKAVEVYEEALEVLPSAKMFSLYVRFWSDVLAPKTDAQHSVLNSVDHDMDLNSNLLRVYETAESRGCITEDLAYQHISFYLLLEKIEEARELAKQYCDGKFSGAAKLWVLRASIEMKWAIKNSTSLSRDDLRSLFELLRNALSHVATSEAKSLWLMIFFQLMDVSFSLTDHLYNFI